MTEPLQTVNAEAAVLNNTENAMQVFCVDPGDYAQTFSEQGYVHISNAVSPGFLAFARNYSKDRQTERTAMKEWEFKQKKQQYLFEFPADFDLMTGLYGFVSTLTGLPLESLTLCERHIKVYEDLANTTPPPHKDRLASQIAVGIPLTVADNSDVILYPDDQLTINPFSSTAAWRSSLDQDTLPEITLQGIEPVRVHVEPGDAILFRGNSIYHERVNPAHTSLLYLKFNALRLDPLGEDPRTPRQAEHSRRLLQDYSDSQLLKCRVEVSPRLENIRRLYTRLYWKEVIQGNLWGEKEFTLGEDELALLLRIEAGDRVSRVLDKLGVPDRDYASCLPMLRRLGNLGAIDFRE